MKKTKFWVLMAILVVVIFTIIIGMNLKKKSSVNEFFLEDILYEINLASNESFYEVSDLEITMHVPFNFSNFENLLFAIDKDNSDEYFIICENPEEKQKEELEQIYSKDAGENNVVFYSDDKHIYVIKSEKYLYMIEGIIESFISNKSKG